MPHILDTKLDANDANENNEDKPINEVKLQEINSEIPDIPVTLSLEEITQQKKKKVSNIVM